MTLVWHFVAFGAALALAASLRISLPARLSGTLRVIGHPAFLLPLVLTVPMTVGLLVTGQISPWPPAVQAAATARYGAAAGIAALLTIVTAELWLLWTPSVIARRFAKPETMDALRGLSLLNLAFGIIVLTLVATLS